jgi:PAS domain S-box-containing protein
LVVLAGVLMLYLRQAIAGPIGQIVTRLKEGETPGYQGISEFEFLSDSIARMMRSLQEKTLHLRAILENMSDGIAVFDMDLRLVAWNRQYVKLNSFPDELIRFGRSYAEIIGYNIERGDYGPGDPEKQLEERLLRVQQVVPDGVEVRRPDGTWVEIKRNRMPAGGLVMTYNDITERKQAEEELAKHRDQLEQLVEARTGELMQVNQRLEEAVRQMQAAKHRAEEANLAKSRFLSSMSHDLRTPLTAIIGFTRLVMRRAEDNLPPKQHANLEKIAISADDLLALIDDILDYTKTEAAHPSEIRLDSLVGECLRTVEPMVNKDRVRLVKEITPDLPQVFTDEKKLKRILINLLSNAVQFTEEGSVRVTVQPRDRQVDIAVQDTGTGIPEEALKRIFDEFEQGEQVRSRRHGGTGLGLAICRRFSQLIGGRIAVQSEVGVGSTFTLTIPVRYSMPSGNDTGADGGACRGMAKPDAMIVSPERDDASGDEESPDR